MAFNNEWEYKKEINNKWWWWKISVWSFNFNSTWELTISWIWFKPRYIQFYFSNQNDAIGNWFTDWTTSFAYESWWWTKSDTECIYLRNASSSAQWRAVIQSMNNDWFTLNITLATANIFNNYIAYE